jgi:hypothetical protein
MRIAHLVLPDEYGGEQDLDLDELLVIASVETERDRVSAEIASWGVLWGQATKDYELAEAASAKWRAQSLVSSLKRDEKVSEWKAKAFADSSPEYVAMVEQEAEAKRNMIAINSVYEAFKSKGRLLERLTGIQQAEIGAAMRVGQETTSAADDPRVKKMRGTIKHPSKREQT